MSWLSILLVIHIALVVGLLMPSVLLPFVLRRSSRDAGPATSALMSMQGTGTMIIAAGLAITGAAMLWILGPELITQPWLLVALTLYAINLGVAAFISRPNLRRMMGLQAPRRMTRPGAGGRASNGWSPTGWRVSSASSAC